MPPSRTTVPVARASARVRALVMRSTVVDVPCGTPAVVVQAVNRVISMWGAEVAITNSPPAPLVKEHP
jgi:hypothetical protein